MTVLLDSNVLIALAVPDHVHNEAADTWLASVDSFATCPITEGSLVRFLIREGQPQATVHAILADIADLPKHTFWPDQIPYRAVNLTGVIGHRQVTDAYLAQLARTHEARLASFDQGLAAVHGDVVDLVPLHA